MRAETSNIYKNLLPKVDDSKEDGNLADTEVLAHKQKIPKKVETQEATQITSVDHSTLENERSKENAFRERMKKEEAVVAQLLSWTNNLPEIYENGKDMLYRNLGDIIENGIIGFSKRDISDKLSRVGEVKLVEILNNDVLNTYFENIKFEDALDTRLTELKSYNIFKRSALQRIKDSKELQEYIQERTGKQSFVCRKLAYWIDIAMGHAGKWDEFRNISRYANEDPRIDLRKIINSTGDNSKEGYLSYIWAEMQKKLNEFEKIN